MKSYILKLFICAFFLSSGIVSVSAVRYHCGADSLKVRELLDAAANGDTYGRKIVEAARYLKGTPLGKPADNDSIGTLVIRLDTLSRREFLNVCIAAAKAMTYPTGNLRDFEKALEEISRQKGVDEGFVSQFRYGSDWIIDNISRGNLKEMTDYLDGGSFRTKTLDYVNRHPEEYPAMADSAVRERVRILEMGYRSHRIPHQKKQSIGNKNLRELLNDGDIIMMLSPDTDTDVYDAGFVVMKDNQPYLIHIFTQTDEVVEDEYPLPRLFKIEGQFFYGYRWLRPTE